MLTITMNSINWTIGQSYELVEKGGAVYELGTLLSIQFDGTLVFKKASGEIHLYRIESNVSYRPIDITPLAILPDILNRDAPDIHFFQISGYSENPNILFTGYFCISLQPF